VSLLGERCVLCEWRCGVDRLAGELGVCRLGLPEVAACMLHPAPPSSWTVFLAGCNFRCLYCDNWDIAHYPDTGTPIDGPRRPASSSSWAMQDLNLRLPPCESEMTASQVPVSA